MSPRGHVVWRGASPYDGGPIVAVVTMHSTNRKTGDMPQLWILREDAPPMDALRAGTDASVCGDCPLRGDGTGTGRACYVTLWQGPRSVWDAMRRGAYPDATPEHVGTLLAGRMVRLGAYGDPAMLPIAVVRALIAHADGWTGYTHQWRRVSREWSGLLMASADGVAARREARQAGWRSFVVLPQGAPMPDRTVACMATRERNPRQCVTCGACAGTRQGATPTAVDIAIHAHGAGAGYVTA